VLEVGLLAQVAGARFAQELNGGLVIAFGLLLLATSLGKRLRSVGTEAPAPSRI
jgi:hypothetical protein